MTAAKQLTAQQRAFAEAFVACGSAQRAAAKAGYKHAEKVGSRLVRIPAVAAEVARLRAKLEQKRDRKTIADAIEIQETLTSFMRDAGEATKDRIAATMGQAKIAGLLKDKVEHSVDLGGMSFRDLLELAKQGGD